MELNQILLLLAIVVGVVIFMRILKATLKLIVIVALIVLVAGYFGLDLVEIGQDVYDRVEEPAVDLIEDGLDMNFTDQNGENGLTQHLQQPVEALRDLGFQVDISGSEVEFWEGDSFIGNVDAESDKFLLTGDLEKKEDRERAKAIIKGLDEDTLSESAQEQVITAIENKNNEVVSFGNGYLEIDDSNFEIQIDTFNG